MQAAPSIEGSIAPGYESVKELFTENFRAGYETHAQLCVFVRGIMVVDLWGSTGDKQSSGFTGDSVTNIFSSTKSLTSLAMAMMVDRGFICYSDKICNYWPEFGDGAKAELTIADLMCHEAGLATLDHEFEPEDFWPESIKMNKVGEVIEKQALAWPANGRREYHALTRGWIANEIFRRVHPSGLTIGEFIQEEVSGPLGTTGVMIGAKEKDCPHYQALVNTEHDSNNPRRRAMINHPGGENGEIWNADEIRRGEIPSANGNCSARGLAKVGAVLANKGELGGVFLLSPAGWEGLHDQATPGTMLGCQTYFTQGGVATWLREDVLGGFYGWYGYGGSCFIWCPGKQISFAYVPCLLVPSLNLGTRARELHVQLMRCVRDIL